MERADSILEEIEQGSPVDLIVLPEMAFTGYKFDNREDIEPYLEAVPADIEAFLGTLDDSTESNQQEPNTFKWAFKVSRKFTSAWVAVGFGERDGDKFYNSAMLVNYELRVCHVVRKVLLFQDDETWANLESDASGIEYNFQHRHLYFPRLDREIKCGVGICMDINWKNFDESLMSTNVLADYQVTNNT